MDAHEITPDDVVYFVAASIDGCIADTSGDDSFLHPYYIPELNFHGFIERVGAVVMGRRTWARLEKTGRWPYGDIPGVIATHRPLADLGGRVAAVDGGPAEILARARELRSKPGAVWLVGGADLATQFLLSGLLTRIELFTAPVLCGDGIRAFRDPGLRALDLISSGTYPKGITRTTWRPTAA